MLKIIEMFEMNSEFLFGFGFSYARVKSLFQSILSQM
jgi:hypothetical protein